jgi:hypothetical protein
VYVLCPQNLHARLARDLIERKTAARAGARSSWRTTEALPDTDSEISKLIRNPEPTVTPQVPPLVPEQQPQVLAGRVVNDEEARAWQCIDQRDNPFEDRMGERGGENGDPRLIDASR